MTHAASSALLRTLVWYETIGYAPTRTELLMTMEVGAGDRLQGTGYRGQSFLAELLAAGILSEHMGRIGFSESLDGIVTMIRARDALQPRKRRRATRVAYWLSRLPCVRFVALANTTALGVARNEGDLDFFVVARAGTIWTTRLIGGLPFRLLGMTPSSDAATDRDAICLSYFVTDDALDLSSHQLQDDDPYFRYWFLSLLPLADDGVSREFWEANATIRERHPFARKWIAPPDLCVDKREQMAVSRWQIGSKKTYLLSTIYDLLSVSFFEPTARFLQKHWFPPTIRNRMNRDTTVMANDQTLKFHVTDRRATYREQYEVSCGKRGIEP